MPTISMTPLSAPGTVLLSALADDVQANHLDDTAAAHFTQAQVEAWLKDAIRDYTKYFPRVRTDAITTSANDRTYDLEADFIRVLSVEYPTGEDPPEYLLRRSRTHKDFWSDDGYYDIVERHDDGDVDEIWISEKPAASETITVIYEADHDYTLTSGEAITVPAEHHHVLKLYAIWQAANELQNQEQEDPTSNSSLLMSMLAQNASLARRDYLQAIAQIERQRGAGYSGRVVWGTKATGEIY